MKTQVTTSKSKFAIVRIFAALFNIGDEGKVENFLVKYIKALKKDILITKKNIENLIFLYNNAIEALQEKIDDARDAYQEALSTFDVTQIQTNEDQTRYQEVYADNLDYKQAVIDSLLKEFKVLEDAHNCSIKYNEDIIAAKQKRINELEKEK